MADPGFPRRGVPTPEFWPTIYYFGKVFVKNCTADWSANPSTSIDVLSLSGVCCWIYHNVNRWEVRRLETTMCTAKRTQRKLWSMANTPPPPSVKIGQQWFHITCPPPPHLSPPMLLQWVPHLPHFISRFLPGATGISRFWVRVTRSVVRVSCSEVSLISQTHGSATRH